MSGVKERDDSIFWKVDKALADCMVRVAAAHALAGGQVVLLTGRKLSPGDAELLAFNGVKVVSTRDAR